MPSYTSRNPRPYGMKTDQTTDTAQKISVQLGHVFHLSENMQSITPEKV